LPDYGALLLYVGVDAAVKHDSAAVVAVYFDQERHKVALARHRIWYPRGAALDMDGTIGDFLRELRDGYRVMGVYFDPWQMQSLAQQLTRDGLTMVEYPQTTANLTAAGQCLYELIKHQNLIAYADADLRRQVSNAVAVENSRGWRIAKEKAANKIDAVVALAMACVACVREGASAGPVVIGEWEW
jgi:phage terminase large subunit-like protein